MTTTSEEVMKMKTQRGIIFNTTDNTDNIYKTLVFDILQIVNEGKKYPDSSDNHGFPEKLSTYTAWKDFQVNAYPEFTISWQKLCSSE
jgi:hypothetical protein